MKALLLLLKNFKFARKRLGGTWYYVEIAEATSGLAGPVWDWTQKTPDSCVEVIATEKY